MTNAQKYEEVFGFPPDKGNCPTECCKWWDEEYKGTHAVKIEITEHHTFAKPDDVEDIKFGD